MEATASLRRTMAEAAFAPTRFAAPDVVIRRDADGTIRLASGQPLLPYDRQIGVWLRRWAAAAPDRVFLAERDDRGGWREMTYADARAAVDQLSQALLDRGLDSGRPLAILSEKSIEHALLSLAAMQVGVPAVPISPSYSLIPQAIERLQHALARTLPAMIYVEDGPPFERALRAVGGPRQEVVYRRRPPGDLPATNIASLLEARAGPAVERAFDAVTPDTVAKVLFTSGSTGVPKAVPNTHRMMCSNQQALAQLFPFYEDAPPVVVDWQPWHHAGGANYNYNMVLRNGGTYYIDLGKPTDAAIGTTLENLRAISPTAHFNVPRGYAMLIPHLESDAELRRSFFRRLEVIVYSAASLPPELWVRLENLSIAARGIRVPMISAWGMTELAPLHTTAHWPIDRAGLIGVPIPGSEVKLVPSQDRFEMRVRGPNVLPFYIGDPELTAASFDEEGFFKTGDAGYLLDPADPAKGLVYDGRLTEEFKLLTGNWVAVGAVRIAVIGACESVVEDGVVVGENRDFLGVLLFPDIAKCRSLANAQPGEPTAAVLRHHSVTSELRRGLEAYNCVNPASSRRIARALLMEEPPSLAAGEITDKGYVNQRAVLARRQALVERLYAPDDPDVIRL
jgi:feruloyl-CoA synthase